LKSGKGKENSNCQEKGLRTFHSKCENGRTSTVLQET